MEAAQITRDNWMEWYSDYVLAEGKRPINVYQFAKKHDVAEADFYKFFAGFESIEQAYFGHFFERSLELSLQIESFETMPAKQQLLNLYFILFENLTMNRSLVLFLLSGGIVAQHKVLTELKAGFKQFVQSLPFDDPTIFEKAPAMLKDIGSKSREEILWLHLLSILNFWKKDRSPAFEKTDAYIEKSIDTGFELVDNPLMDKIADLGKFLWKEKFKAG